MTEEGNGTVFPVLARQVDRNDGSNSLRRYTAGQVEEVPDRPIFGRRALVLGDHRAGAAVSSEPNTATAEPPCEESSIEQGPETPPVRLLRGAVRD